MGWTKALDGEGGLRQGLGVVICLFVYCLSSVLKLPYLTIHNTSYSSSIKFLVCALIFIKKLVISASMLYTFPELLSHKLLIILLIFLHFCFSKFLL